MNKNSEDIPKPKLSDRIDEIQVKAVLGATITGMMLSVHRYRNTRSVASAAMAGFLTWGLTGLTSLFYFRGRQKKHTRIRYV